MKRLILSILACLLLAAPALAFDGACQDGEPWQLARMNPAVLGSGGSADYCSGQAWNTLTSFRLDFDHTTNTSTACLSSGTQVGSIHGSPSISNPTPTTTGIGSGGNGLIADASGEYIVFNNNSNIFISKWGSLRFKFKIAGDNTATNNLLQIIGTSNQDRLGLYVASTGRITYLWEDNDHGVISGTPVAADVDSYYEDWIQVALRWDTTRCTDGTCDGVGEDELCFGFRVDANNDGDFDDGGAETWSAWFCDTSATDMNEWASEPWDGSISFGLIDGTYSYQVDVDDLEISNAQPTWD